MIEAGQYLSALGLSALEAVSEKGAPLLAFALLDLPLLWQLLSLLPCLRFPALWIELLGLLVRSLAQWLLQAGASGVFAGDLVARSAHSRSGVLPLRRSAEEGLICRGFAGSRRRGGSKSVEAFLPPNFAKKRPRGEGGGAYVWRWMAKGRAPDSQAHCLPVPHTPGAPAPAPRPKVRSQRNGR